MNINLTLFVQILNFIFTIWLFKKCFVEFFINRAILHESTLTELESEVVTAQIKLEALKDDARCVVREKVQELAIADLLAQEVNCSFVDGDICGEQQLAKPLIESKDLLYEALQKE